MLRLYHVVHGRVALALAGDDHGNGFDGLVGAGEETGAEIGHTSVQL